MSASERPLARARLGASADPTAARFTASLAFDRRLGPHDIVGSMAWARALARAGLLTDSERDRIVAGLAAVRSELEAGTFPFRPELEDIHMNVERRLLELIGEAAGKLHTGRSRNDQIALDERLYLKDVVVATDGALRAVQQALVARATDTVDAPMPGYTHMQRAQPVVLAHHLLAYVFMLQRDRDRFAACATRADVLPLGAGALAGAAFPIDREALARDLGFAAVSLNSLDAVSDRDYVLDYLAAAAITGMHLSRLAADLALWATAEFGFVEFSDAFATGSSIMPQKKNPDVAELIRGKSGRLYGNLMAVLTVMKGLPLAYNSDMQEDKEAFFDSVDTLEAIGGVLPPMLGSLAFRTDRMRMAAGENFATATDLADYLVRQGLPFREGHEIVGKIVRYALDRGVTLEQLSLDELRRFSDRFAADVHQALTVEASLRARAVTGGTAPDAVRRALARAREMVGFHGGLDMAPNPPSARGAPAQP
jgi:argininosuccinate lyase